MARLIELIATTTGSHYLEFGFNANELASFSLQMWITKYGARAVDWMQGLSLGFISFMGGDVWVHNSDAVPRVNFFGEQKYTEVGVEINENPNIIKLLDSIGIHSDGKWSIESVTIPKTLNTPSGMLSKLPKERFKRRDGVWQAEFLRNMKSTSDTASIAQAINGEPLKGYAAYLVLRNTDTTEVRLFKIDFYMTSIRG